MTKTKTGVEAGLVFVTEYTLKEARNQSAHSSAVARYNAKNYKTFSVNLKKDEYDNLLTILATTNQSKSGFVRAALDYASENEQFLEYLRHIYETK